MTLALVLAVLALLLAGAAAAITVGAHSRLTRLRRELHALQSTPRPGTPAPAAALAPGQPDDAVRGELAAARADLATTRREVEALRGDLASARAETARSLRNVAVVRYDAFGDMGGRLSFSAALVDDAGDGLVLSSIHARAESRTYAKGVVGGSCDVTLTPEEQEALAAARSGRTVR